MRAPVLAANDKSDLDFHAIMHWGEDAGPEKADVPRRSQRTRSVLTLFVQDGLTHTLVDANADLAKATQSGEVLTFCSHWRAVSGHDPGLLVFSSRLTTQAMLVALDARGVRFLTLRMRTSALVARIAARPAGAWRTVALDRAGDYRRPRVSEKGATRLSDYPGTVRQLILRGLGREAPTVLITDDWTASARSLVELSARRMTIEQRPAEAIRSFGVDAPSSAVPLPVHDVALSILAGALCASPRHRLHAMRPPPPTRSSSTLSPRAARARPERTRSSSDSTAGGTH